MFLVDLLRQHRPLARVLRPSVQISWPEDRRCDAVVRVLLRCGEAWAVHVEDCRAAREIRYVTSHASMNLL